ncbi:MAG: glycosyltransferase family 4 protein [Anaerolineales bacterium]
MSFPRPSSRVVLALTSVIASGTERRLAFVYRHLIRKAPDGYLLLVTPELFSVLNRGGYRLDGLPNVHLLGGRSPFDRKAGAHATWWVNVGRMFTLQRYSQELRRWIERGHATLIHLYLEMVPYHALFPLREVPAITAVVDHLPKYFDPRTLDCQLLLRAIRHSWKADCLYPPQARRLAALGVDRQKLNDPGRNCVNHEAFHPEEKCQSVTFSARAIDWKLPDLMPRVAEIVLRKHPDTMFHLLGKGPLVDLMEREIAMRRLEKNVKVGYREDPSSLINRSLVHVSLDRYDNFTNQSLLEGMASGCAIVASDVGETGHVVTPEVGRLAHPSAEAVAESILELLSNPKAAMAMGRAAREKVLREHHVDDYVEYMLALHDLTRSEPIVGGEISPTPRGNGDHG